MEIGSATAAGTQASIGFALTRKTLDTVEDHAAGLMDMLNTPVAAPSFGHKLDIRV